MRRGGRRERGRRNIMAESKRKMDEIKRRCQTKTGGGTKAQIDVLGVEQGRLGGPFN